MSLFLALAIRACALALTTAVVAAPAMASSPPSRVRLEFEAGVLWEAPGSSRSAVVSAFEFSASAPFLEGTFNAELEGGQRAEGGPPHGPNDFVFNRNLLFEASPLKIGRTAWARTWSPAWHTLVGRFAPESFLDKVTFASNKTERFLARPFVRPTAVADPGTGLGVLAHRDFTDGSRLTFLTNDAHGTARLSPAHTLSGDWFHALQVQRPHGTQGRVRLLTWLTRRHERRAHGVSFSYEDRFTPELGWFVRTGREHGDLARSPRLFAGGVSWEHDARTRFGTGWAWGRGVPEARREALLEVFARREIARDLAISLHAQSSRRTERPRVASTETQLIMRLMWTGVR